MTTALPSRALADRRYGSDVFLGEDLLGFLVLALGGAMAVGNVLALVRPPATKQDEDNLDRAPVVRSVVFAVVGTIAAVWALASLLTG